jgi:hypothetical protein
MTDESLEFWRAGYEWAARSRFEGSPTKPNADIAIPVETNPFRAFANARREGHGIWKWDHYFDIYERHFGRFRGQEVHLLEIGVYSGGSLDMWRYYFGKKARIYGVDVHPACKAHEGEQVKIYIGDQGDGTFWQRFKNEVPTLDIVIDDGGHSPEQQRVTFEHVFPHLRPGGVFLCEDVHGELNHFASYAHALAHQLNDCSQWVDNSENERRIVCGATGFQSAVNSVHFYPYVVVLERTREPVQEFVAPKHGSKWAF